MNAEGMVRDTHNMQNVTLTLNVHRQQKGTENEEQEKQNSGFLNTCGSNVKSIRMFEYQYFASNNRFLEYQY